MLDNKDVAAEALRLPENSQGLLADNPTLLERWHTGEGIVPSEWPYLMLCQDTERGTFTWHMLCNEYPIPRYVNNPDFKPLVDARMSTDRQRQLVGVELLCRRGNQHIFLTSTPGHQFPHSLDTQQAVQQALSLVPLAKE